jgi:quercetin dioxygenase-like cupin family protein
MFRSLRLPAAVVLGIILGNVPWVLSHAPSDGAGPDLPPGSNERLRAPLSAAPDLEVIISDVIIPPGGAVPRHYHPGEEFVYVIAGSATHVEEGKADRTLTAGDALVIPPQAVHAPRAGPDGGRAIVFRVHVKGQPERIPVPESP